MAEDQGNYKALYKEQRQKYKLLKNAAQAEILEKKEIEQENKELEMRLNRLSEEINEVKALNLHLQDKTE